MDPLAAFEVLFGVAVDPRAFARRGELLSVARADVGRALTEFPSSHERLKLEHYLESLEGLTERQAKLLGMADQIGEVTPAAPEVGGPDDAFARLDQQIDLAAAALLGGLTNVVVVGIGTGGDFNLAYPSLSTQLRHAIMHESEEVDATREVVHDNTKNQIDRVARLASILADTPDVDAPSMLDNTLVMYLPESGEKHHSAASEWPTLLLGGETLGLRKAVARWPTPAWARWATGSCSICGIPWATWPAWTSMILAPMIRRRWRKGHWQNCGCDGAIYRARPVSLVYQR